MRSRSSVVFISFAFAVLFAGCGVAGESLISPVPAERGGADLGLGPGVRALTSGPGDKGSPVLSPSGERLAFVMDGYVMEKDLATGTSVRRTTRDFGADTVDWSNSGDGLVISSISEADGGFSFYRTSGGDRDLNVQPIFEGALAVEDIPGETDLLVAFEGEAESSLARLQKNGEPDRLFTRTVDGDVTGISLSPSGEQAAISVRQEESYAIFILDLQKGTVREAVRTATGKEILGYPQWTRNGIYYIAGEGEASGKTPVYDLYRLLEDTPADAEIVSEVGEDFVSSSIRVSPDGGRLAVLGRRSLNSPANLYILDLESGDLQTATSNENLSIKTGPKDLSWSTDGESVLLVAQAVPDDVAIRPASAERITADFNNIYEVPVGDLAEEQ